MFTGWKKIEFPKVCNLGTTRLRGKPRNRCENEVRENGNVVGGRMWKERVYNRGEWKKLRRAARNSRILHMSMNEYGDR